ncbi:MAG: YtxH domain-containing protein [Thermomicrobiales bacterium]|nr:YtxH domain-containing protein [Thermomicrobiales bacterium]
MSLIGRAFKFTVGTATGLGIGAVVGLLVAPESGQDLQRNLRERITRAKLDGSDAKLSKQTELIQRYRVEVNDPDALRELEATAKAERDQAAIRAS